MKVEEVQTDLQARRFLPDGGGAYGLVLMIRAGDPDCMEAIRQAAEHPDRRSVHVLDVERFSTTSSWFGIADVPTFAVVAHGSLVAIERGYRPGLFSRLDEAARAVLRRIDDC